MIRYQLVSAVLVAGSSLSFAYADELEQKKNVTQLNKISVESSQEPVLEPIEISTSTHLAVDPKDKERNATASLGASLETLPGVNNLGSGSQSGKPVVRGDTSLRLPVLSNGVAMEYQAEGTRHNPNVDPALMEKVEVIRGPQGLKYSSQAVKSAVNVEGPQLDYAAPGKTRTSGALMGEVNSNNHETMLGAKAKYSSNGIALIGGVTKRKGENYVSPRSTEAGDVKPGDPAGTKPLVTGTIPYTNFEGQSAVFGVGYLGNWGSVELHHSFWESKQNYLGVEADPAGYELIPSAGQKLKNEETQLKAEIFQGDWVFKPLYAHSRNQREAMHDVTYEDMDVYETDPEYLDLVVHRNDYQLAVEHPDFKGWSGEFGVSFLDKDQKLRSGHLSPSATENGTGIFMVEKQTFGQWDVEIGGRYDSHRIKAPLSPENAHFWDETQVYDASNNERSFSDWSGALGVAFHASPNWTFTGNLGRSFRAPSVFELYASGAHGGVQAYQVGNPDLKAETSINSELAATWQSAKLHSTLAVYSNWVDNYIVLENTATELYCDHEGVCQSTQSLAFPYRKMVNAQTNALIQGVEWSAKYQMTSQLQWRATAEIMQGRDTQNNRELPLMPAPNATLDAKYTFKEIERLKQPYLGLGTRYVAEKKAAGLYEPFSQYDNLPFGTASTSDYWLWNLSAGTGIRFDQRTLWLDLTVENMLDTPYRDFLDTYKGIALGMGRNFKLNARMDF
ncbi:TonB-dependent receptor [Hydrogenovibrio sp. 3SP14C1]|uniref:TonB-dependent receptor n=1 Tax=Hydrogenovibrio sp. 3SP14C1 TaxID=3038774 RepID=UPI0024163BAA|nr:TonB-dependent receptor [Hydrogenovibrio sp. 3SP14C1]MDG4811445.1 TonB-dependent receptor [Hydrogenovibrio sp. 3SP14C1]